MSVKNNSFGIAPLQQKMLEVLKEFISLCEAQNLRYWLAGGSLIGVVRHHGFIPWDDDLDVFMPRPDYEKMWSLLGGAVIDGHFVLCRTNRGKNYHHRVMQLVDTETTFIHSRCRDEDIEHGVYIDIIPLDGCPNGKLKRLSQIVNAIIYSIYNIQCPPEYNSGKLTGIITFLSKIMLGIVKSRETRYRIWKKAEARMTRYSFEDCEYVKVITADVYALLHPFLRDWFKGTQTGQFEDINVSIPSGTEEYLTLRYGDYMELPPKSKQVTVHHTECIDLNRPYTEYKGKYYCVGGERNDE